MAPVSLKNSRDTFVGKRRTKSGKIVVCAWPKKSPECEAFEKIAIPAMRLAAKSLPVFPKRGKENVRLDVRVTAWYPNMRRDLDVEIVYDCLQKAGVIDNDRWIVKKTAIRHPDPGERCVVEVREAVPF